EALRVGIVAAVALLVPAAMSIGAFVALVPASVNSQRNEARKDLREIRAAKTTRNELADQCQSASRDISGYLSDELRKVRTPRVQASDRRAVRAGQGAPVFGTSAQRRLRAQQTLRRKVDEQIRKV